MSTLRLMRMISALVLTVGALSVSIAAAPVASAATVISVAAGFSHTCALTSANGVKCWGSNTYGELGNGTTTDSYIPVNVSGLTSGVAAVSSGGHESCALTTSGGVMCWGYNAGGKLGNETTTDSAVPVPVTGLSSSVSAVSVGQDHVCALLADARIKCWGSNSRGQLGNGTTISSSTPILVPGLAGILGVSSGYVHTCALTDLGGVKCWGYNAYGQVGNGSIDPAGVLQPTDVVGLTGAVAIFAGGYHSCALTTGGGATCWGQDQYGELGDGSNVNSSVPVAVSGLSTGVAALSGGAYHTCAVTTSQAAMCWGANNTGNLGDGTTTNSSVPLVVSGFSSGVASISAGRLHSCSVSLTGRTQCWGWNLYGQVGNGTTSGYVLTPVDVSWFRAGFTANCSGLVCDFSDTSADPGGEIATRSWNFGDGATGSGAITSHGYAVGGSYTVTLTASDGAFGTSTASQTLVLTPWNLKVSGSRVRGVNIATLTWSTSASSATSIDVYRNGSRVATTQNTSSYSESVIKRGTFTYYVCPTGSTRCSNTASVTF